MDEVYLGSRNILDSVAPTHQTRFEIINIDGEDSAEHFFSPHKIPNNLWSVFEKSRGVEDTAIFSEKSELEPTSTPELTFSSTFDSESTPEAEKLAPAGSIVAGITTYDLSEAEPTVPGEIIEVDDLPKPSEQESELLVITRIPQEEEEEENESGKKDPKSFDFNQPGAQSVDPDDVKAHSFGAEQINPLR